MLNYASSLPGDAARPTFSTARKRSGLWKVGLPLSSLAVVVFLFGCSLAPEYNRPAAPVPAALGEIAKDAALSLPPWSEFLPDPRLKAVISRALENNRDLRLALLRVYEAGAEHGLARSDRLPRLEAEGRETVAGGAGRETNRDFEAGLALPSFEIDYLSRLGDLSRAALERRLATTEAYRFARLALLSSATEAYLNGRLARERLGLTRRNLQSFRASLAFVEKRLLSGQTDLLALEQAKGLVAFAETQVAAREAEIVRVDNALSLILGDFDLAALPEATSLSRWPKLVLPAGLRSDALLSRPDVLEAEHALKAAYADIGAARAAFFPQISLTGALGLMSLELSSLFSGGGETWNFGPQIRLPIFSGGRNKASLDLAEIRKDMAVTAYETVIQNAFREVREGLAMRPRLEARLKAQNDYLAAQRRVLSLATSRYQNGVVSYLEVLEAQRNVLEAESALLEIKTEMIFNDVSLYVALGGGFPQDEEFSDKPASSSNQ
ncbi:MAG: efflux transporter outer membrane subunit [Deltaproteobacteria bacterium]|nr:efflux transporter outer membrane subunit [Deltaproteobacteria bacterium]